MRFFVLIGLLVCVACSSVRPYYVNVSGLAAPQLDSPATFDVLPLDENTQAQDLQFLEYKSYLARAMVAKGFVPAATGELPEVIVFLDYGIGEPQTKVTSYNVPIYGQTGISSSQTTGNANTTLNTYGSYGTANTTYNQTTTYTPTYGITGYATNTTSYNVYTRYIVIDGFFTSSWEEKRELLPAFKTSVVSSGSSGDLRSVFPVMIGAASEYIGRSTDKTISVTLTEGDKRVLAVRGVE
ncbi:hypothetical protein [Hyphomonas sp. ND6WE1B]|uniref:hypothetical protein n=1 Tax=Hyphomonas sp. ND6WE1B TaxID=1848191 RepID=UPI0011118D1D|nr:hypothetical protein [Hyphomonas sp. ND6WE1B]